MSSHSMTAASPMAPPTTTPTASTLPAPLLPVVEGVAVVLVVGVPVEEAAAEEELVATAWTSVGWRVPQVLQDSEPGLAWRQLANNWLQIWLGRVSR